MLVLALTTLLFAVSMFLFEVAFIKSGKVTSCFGILRQECSFVDGSITVKGAQVIATIIAIQVVVNLAPYLLMVRFFQRTQSAKAAISPALIATKS